MDRRNFLTLTTTAALGSTIFLTKGCRPGNGNGTIDSIGVQLYTVRSLLADDFEGTLQQIAEIGYNEVEFAGYYGRTPQRIRELLNELNLLAPAAHVQINDVRENLDQLIESASEIGHDHLVVPWLAESERTLDGYKQVAEDLNRAGERCSEAGIQLNYHNHEFEFDIVQGQIPYEILLEETDPDNLKMELDIYWIVLAGRDPLEYFERYPGRFPLCHVKDMDADGNMVDVGAGQIDFASIFAKADQAGLEHYFIEHDNPPSPLESIRNSYNHFSQLRIER